MDVSNIEIDLSTEQIEDICFAIIKQHLDDDPLSHKLWFDNAFVIRDEGQECMKEQYMQLLGEVFFNRFFVEALEQRIAKELPHLNKKDELVDEDHTLVIYNAKT